MTTLYKPTKTGLLVLRLYRVYFILFIKDTNDKKVYRKE